MKRFKYGVLIILTVMTLGLTGCEDPEERRKAKENAELEAKMSSERAYIRKLNRYVEFYNFISEGLSNEQRNLVSNERAFEDSQFRSITISPRFLLHSLNNHIKELQEMDFAIPQLDSELRSYQPIIQDASKLFQEFDSYLKKKRYEDDNGNRGKELFVQYLAEIDKLSSANESFFNKLKSELAAWEVKKIDQFKDSGRMIEYHSAKSSAIAKQILNVLNENFDGRAFSECDGLVSQLESQLDGLNKAIRKGDTGGKDWKSVYNELNHFASTYRELRQNQNAQNMNRLLTQYNKVAETFDRLN